MFVWSLDSLFLKDTGAVRGGFVLKTDRRDACYNDNVKEEENGNEMSHGINMVMMHLSMFFFKRWNALKLLQ